MIMDKLKETKPQDSKNIPTSADIAKSNFKDIKFDNRNLSGSKETHPYSSDGQTELKTLIQQQQAKGADGDHSAQLDPDYVQNKKNISKSKLDDARAKQETMSQGLGDLKNFSEAQLLENWRSKEEQQNKDNSQTTFSVELAKLN